MINYILKKLGLIKKSKLNESLNFARSVGKRLDEHREVVECIESTSDFFTKNGWHGGHMAIQDDYLMRLYHMVHGSWPEDHCLRQKSGELVRARPKTLGTCRLPEYPFKDLDEGRKGSE